MTRLAGGKTPASILAYMQGVQFPAKKEDIIRTAASNGAPNDIVSSLTQLPHTDYASPDDVIRDYPRLPEEYEVDGVHHR